VKIASKTTTAANIRQRYWLVSGVQKLDALTRILEAEPFDAMIVFTRTKQATEELAERLQARGFSAAAINGDIVQAQRERTIQQLKDGKIDILVATDVAARGLDVERISHVLNYDIPNDTEPYVHRIGRTGRAGRSGEAILFVAPRERGMLRAIERATRQTIEPMQLPSVETVNEARVAKFKDRITSALAADGLAVFRNVIEAYEREHNVPAIEIASALARLAQGDKSLLLDAKPRFEPREFAREERAPRKFEHDRKSDRAPARDSAFAPSVQRGESSAGARAARDKPKTFDEKKYKSPASEHRNNAFAAESPPAREHKPRSDHDNAGPRAKPSRDTAPREAEHGMETFRIEVGHVHGVKPNNIVGAIANEAGLDAKHIGRIDIRDEHSLIDLPEGMPVELLAHLKKVWVSGQRLRITRDKGEAPSTPFAPKHAKPKEAKKKRF